MSIKTKLLATKTHIRASFRDAVYTNLNIGMAESYFCAFLLALGISEVVAGFSGVLAAFMGVCFQLLSIRSFFLRWTLKRRVLFFLGLQALSMIPLMFMGLLRYNSAVLAIGMLGLYWACLLSVNPPWNRLMGHTIPVRFRLKFFSMRNQYGQFSVFLGLIIGGVALNWAKEQDLELQVFTLIFVLGFLLRLLSWRDINKHHIDYQIPQGVEVRLPMWDFLKRIRNTDQGKLIKFLFFFYIAVHSSSPYFNPYMLSQLKLSYLGYMGVIATSFFGRVFMFRFLQKKAKSRHINNLLVLSSFGIATTPLLWNISQSYPWILFIEMLSGCYWAGFELSTILLFYQKIEDHERTSVMSYITFFNITGMVIGSLSGALMMKLMPAHWDSYLALFMISTFLRASVVFLTPHISFKGSIPRFISFNRVFMTRSPYGALTRPIVDKIDVEKQNGPS